MAVHVLISHTGQHLAFENLAAGLDALREWISQNVDIPPNRQILMTARGKNVKTLTAESEIFVYDKKNLSSSPEIPPDEHEALTDLPVPDDAPAPDSDLEAWKDAVRRNRTWALEAAEQVKGAADQTQELFYEADTIARGILAALDNVKNGFASASVKFNETKEWAQESLLEHQMALDGWEKTHTRLSELPVREEVAAILRRSDDGPRSRQQISTLADLVDLQAIKETDAVVRTASKDFRSQLDELQSRRNQLQEDINVVEKHVSHIAEPDTASLLQEVETLAKRISRDYDDILKLPDDAKSLGQASRKASNHTRDLIPAIQAVMADMQQAFIAVQDSRNAIVRGYFAALKEISSIQSRLSNLQANTAALDFREADGLDVLFRVVSLHVVYGCTLIEATRRSEWTNKMQVDVDNMHADLTQVTEDEQRRRKKWASSYDDFLNKDLNTPDSLIDLKTSKPRNPWPFVEREEINAYIDDLRALSLDEAVTTIVDRLKDLDSPVKRQRLRAFKNGSVQDLAASSNLGNADVRTLQNEKARLEEKVKSTESRVRKLEDLLHRQSQMSRPSSALFTPGMSDYDRHSPSPSAFPKQSELPQRPSIPLRRTSTAAEDKAVAIRISSLEAEVKKLQSEAHEERRSSTENRDKMQEAESVKQDLMANFEAQKQEFDEERQIMDDENHKLKVRIEELEDELDRILGSKEATKMTNDQKMHDIQSEADELREALRNEQQKSQTKIENLERDLATQRERTANIDRQWQECREERNTARDRNMELAKQLRLREEASADVISTLQNTHSNLSPAGSAPDEIGRLARALEILSEGAGIHARRLDDNLQLATAENKSLEDNVTHMEAEVKNLTSRLSSAESKSASLGESLDHERSKLKAVRVELADAQADLDSLREKLAAGETGSDSLRERLSEEEKKVKDLQELKFEHLSSIKSLKNEVESISQQTKQATDRADKLKKKLVARGEKARQLSERLYQHNDRIIRMLEQFGFSIIRQDDTLVIQRASKVSASTMLSGNESSTPMKRTISGSVPPLHYSDPSDLDTLYWTSDTESTDEEAKYKTFISALQRLDLDSTLDTVSKRYKDVENLAKKYQKDSRTYRERSHRLQSETHEKIAYRSFKEGDLALFLPTRNQATRPWAAFNVGAPHYFLREQDHHKLQSRDWLLARISRVEERVVDLSRSLSSTRADGGSKSMHGEVGDSASARSFEDENPFELSDGLRWYLIDAAEEKPGAPGTPSVGKSTVIASNVEAEASLTPHRKDKSVVTRAASNAAITKTLNKSLESRRSSSASKRSGSIRKQDRDSSSLKDVQAALAPIVSDVEAGASDEQRREATEAENDAQNQHKHQQPMVKSTERTSRGDAKVFDIGPLGDRHHDVNTQRQQPRMAYQHQDQLFSPADYYNSPMKPPLPRGKSETNAQAHTLSKPLLSRTQSSTQQTPSKQQQRNSSPSKNMATPSPSKKGWERLFNVEFNA
ncbi:Autophagy-related protein 11 [Cyphellophora attinorum]|uniref:Autophagy-related protein 11 n=1 Tax=Cyphellophora attinorum TaxID=1664694 RepID=A0A0N1P199_9EURO|nr:Autophagy-related protein 11 [Phialophora attinorum]KPI40323.1 Autophagy-related protein 11 [Phialophora attinorum]